MSSRTRLYDAFGELLYVVAMADGIIQPEEVEMLHEIARKYPFGEDMQWSFDYERANHNDVEDLYQRVLDICYDNGPDPEYQTLIDILEEVAHASSGIDEKEQKVIDRFIFELTERFKKDLGNIK